MARNGIHNDLNDLEKPLKEYEAARTLKIANEEPATTQHALHSIEDEMVMKRWGKRHVQILLGMLLNTVNFAVIVNISIAIVVMTDVKGNGVAETYDWDKKTQNYIMSSAFLGQTLMLIPFGMVAQKYGWKKLTVVNLTVSGVLSLTFPIVTKMGGWFLSCISRFLLGISLAHIVPCAYSMLGKWCPLLERGRNTAVTHSGSQFGRILMMSVSGWLCTSSIGWPLAFYSTGIFTLFAALMVALFGASSPDEHPTISREELNYIKRTSGNTLNQSNLKIPWSSILTSAPVWASIIAECGLMWCVNTMLEVPPYLNAIFHIDIRKNGALSALPYVGMFLMTFTYSFMFDFLIRKRKITIGQARKISNTIAMWLSAVFLVAFSFVPAPRLALACVFLFLATAVLAGVNCGFQVVLADITPNFSGPTKAVSMAFGCMWATIAPLTNGAIMTDLNDLNQWRTVFGLAAVILFIVNIIFLIFATSNLQPWNDLKLNTKVADQELIEITKLKLKN